MFSEFQSNSYSSYVPRDYNQYLARSNNQLTLESINSLVPISYIMDIEAEGAKEAEMNYKSKQFYGKAKSDLSISNIRDEIAKEEEELMKHAAKMNEYHKKAVKARS